MKAPELIFIGLDGAVDSFIAKEVEKGDLPNFARLLKRGCRMTDFRPVHPTITPVCWSALQTGATPEINGVITDKLYTGGHLNNLVSTYNGTHLKAERFWEAAARGGKSSLVDCLPVSGPRRSDKVWQLEGTSANPGRMVMPDGSAEYVDIPQQIWLFDTDKQPAGKLKDIKQPASGVQVLKENVYELCVDISSSKINANRHRFLPFVWQLEAAENGFVLIWEQGRTILCVNQWCAPFTRSLQTENGSLELTFRFGCFKLEDGFVIFGSAACNIRDRAWPEEFAGVLRDMPPTPVHRECVFCSIPATNKITMDSWNFHIDWHIEMFKRVLKKYVPEIIVTYMGDIDTVNHYFWPKLSGAIETTPEEYRFIEQCFREIYQTADRYIGYFLDEVADENTIFMIVSDHGSIGVKEERNINKALEKAGLLHFSADGSIDWTKTRAACRGCGHIFVNLEEREGIVPASEYESTVDEIITALQDHLRGPAGDSYLAFAVRRREAGFFGLGGELCGDVVFGLTAGYAAMTVHAEQIPTATNEFGSMRAFCLLSGPGVPQNCIWDKPVNSIDMAPTLCTKLGVPLPADSNGRIIWDFVNCNKK